MTRAPTMTRVRTRLRASALTRVRCATARSPTTSDRSAISVRRAVNHLFIVAAGQVSLVSDERFVALIVLSIDVDAQCGKLATVAGHTKLTTLATVDVPFCDFGETIIVV